ncbi:23S rRNA (cytosine1962-C5)-methyltransferase [Litoreibacter ponti]|uniref:23S rRNA (Cytosine1962-C5)-methyltransferase n=1 Tax=Litoreibacter ponti TaxID=1510457 RepID=A0A2T6BD58_9RHOB|nr:class I SAM-dependent rRNA methyltransferase [Litoreibacter ponti]PTX54005.1 23S rRNA (cytosine1962-C5)-methyltransferase [Litoreibacter ponti]
MSASPFSVPPYPVVRLKPKANTAALNAGAPWVYADELVTDRRTRRLPPGSLAVLEDAGRTPMALVTVNPESKIIARVMDRDPGAVPDADWLRARIERALSLRSRLYAEPFYRLVHAEADGLPGVIIDRFGDTLVMQPNAAWAEQASETLADILCEVTGASCVIKNASGRARGLEGLDDVSSVMRGEMPGPIEVPMNGATYIADVEGGQKTGLFYDQRDNHAFAAKLSEGARVLDVFSHVGGFSLAALAAGAASGVAVDGSEAALALAEQGAQASGLADRFETRKGDAFKVMEALIAEGAQFDVVVADPPAFAPNKQALANGLTAYARVASLASKLVAPGGYLVLCSCSHAADVTKFRQASLRGIARAERAAQLLHTGAAGPDHPMHPALAESGYLKSLFFRLD